MRIIPAIMIWAAACSIADAQVRTKIPGGTVVLQPGYLVATTSKTGAVFERADHDEPLFESQVGASVAPRLTDKNIEQCRWSRKTEIQGRKVLMGIWKEDDIVTVTIFGKSGVDRFKSANFFGEFDRVEEVGDVILTALSFEPVAAP